MNIPDLNWNVYRRHELEVGAVVEEMAYESCRKAAIEEKELTLNNIQKMKNLL